MKRFNLTIGSGTLSYIMEGCKRNLRFSRDKAEVNQIQSFHDYIFFTKAWVIDKKHYSASELWNECFKIED